MRVKIAKGGGNSESIDVNLSEFDPKSTTAVEMFAYCQYKDAMGEGSDHKWGSWNAIKKIISSADGMNFGSLENIMNEKRDWTGALAESKTYMENPKTGETLSAADLLKMFEERNKLTAEGLKEGDDWRSMSDEDWDGFLGKVSGVNEKFEQLLAGKEIRCVVRENLPYHRINEKGDNIWTALLETGYLTKTVNEKMPIMPLRIPNRGIQDVFRQEVWDCFFGKRVMIKKI